MGAEQSHPGDAAERRGAPDGTTFEGEELLRVTIAMNSIPFSGTVSWRMFCRAQWRALGAMRVPLAIFPFALTWYVRKLVIEDGAAVPEWTYLVILLLCIGMLVAIALLLWRRVYVSSPQIREFGSGKVSPAGVFGDGPRGTIDMEWVQFTKVVDGGDVLLLYHSPYVYNLLTKECFSTDQEWQTAKSWAVSARAGA